MKTLVAAAAADDAKAAWPLLSKPSQRREGSLAAFAKNTWPTLRRELAPFAGGALPVQISENIDDRFGVIALSRGKHAYAAAMRRTGPTWLVELPGPLRLDVLGPPPGSRGKFLKQIGVESHGHQGTGLAILYLDGVTLDPNVSRGADERDHLRELREQARSRRAHGHRFRDRGRQRDRARLDVPALALRVRCERGARARSARACWLRVRGSAWADRIAAPVSVP